MSLTLRDLTGLITLSLRDPRVAALALRDLAPGPGPRRLALIVVAILTAVQIHLSIPMLPVEIQQVILAANPSPIFVAVISAGMIWLAGTLTHRIGRRFGGTGSADLAQWYVIWAAFVRLCLLAGVLVLYLVAPPLAGLADLAALILSLHVFSGLVCALHGFRSQWKVIGMTLVTGISVGIAANILFFIILQGLAGAS